MRITNNMMVQNSIRDINGSLVRLSKLQAQASSQKVTQVPSDDPVAASRSLKLQSYLAAIKQEQKNAEDASSWMEFSDSALSQLSDCYDQIRELTVQAANGTLTDDDKSIIKTQIEELQEEIIDIANSSYSGKFVFAGYSTDSSPFELVSTDVGDMVVYNGKYLSLGGVVATSVSDSDLTEFFMNNMDKISGQAELKSANFESFTAAAPALNFTITLDGVTQTISLSDGVTYDIDSLVTELQSSIDAAFPSDTGQPDSLIKVSNDEGKIVLTVQEGSSITIGSGTLDVGKLGFSDGMTSTAGDSETILYKLGTNNYVAVNAEGSDIFGEGSESLFNTLQKIELALAGETQYKTATYSEGPPAGVTIQTYDLDLSSLLDDLDNDIDRLLTAQSGLGSRTNYVNSTQSRLEDNYTTYSELLSENDDIDLAEVTMQLSAAEATYTAALSAGAKVIQNTLLDYIG
jgi:flagellar hook-associated protein 3 FlgL